MKNNYINEDLTTPFYLLVKLKLTKSMKHNYLRKPPVMLLLAFMLTISVGWAQNITVTGTVTDAADGSPLPGATISVKGTLLGTSTDFNGKYSFTAPENATLIFSFVGYKDQEIPLNGRATVDISLEEDITSLSEVVVVGYGVQRKRDVTGSIAKVSGEKIKELPVPSFEAGLQGRAAGVQVIQGSGLAGSGSVIRVRGAGSISAGGDPLYVIDGIPVTQDPFLNNNRGAMNQNPLAAINPNDIESIEVLKDAGAAGIYGSRGANGVILITTKRGQSGKPQFNFSTSHGFSAPAVRPEFTSGEEYLQLRQEAWENDGNTGAVWVPGFSSAEASAADREAAFAQASQNNTDWWDLTTRTGYIQTYDLSMSQGTDKFKTYLGASYSDNQSYLRGNSYERLAFRANVDWTIVPKLKASLSSSFSRGQNNRVDAAWSGGLGQAMSTALPIYPVRNPDGTFFTNGANPVRVRELLDWRTVEQRTVNTLSLDYNPIKNLTFRVTGGVDYLDLREDQYRPQELLLSNHIGEAKRFPAWVTNINTNATATYIWDMDENNSFTFLLGTEYQQSTTERYDEITLVDVDGPLWSDPNIGGTLNDEGDSLYNRIAREGATAQWSFLSYFGRINYNLKDRYIFQVLARVDGSSRFGANNRFGFFPAVSGAWVISEENFMQDQSTISFLKLRSSYGITGNANIPNFEWIGTYVPPANNLPYAGGDVIFPERLENPNLQWETLTTWDLGLEMNFLADRIQTEINYYNKVSRDVLINRTNPPSTGFGNFWDNIAEIRNTGVELQVSSRNLVGELKWTTDFNIARNNNEVLDIGDLTPDAVGGGTNDTRIVPGEPVGANFLVRFHGVDPEDGLPIWLDADGNLTKEFSLDHRVVVGSVVPDAWGGITNTFSYKNIDLSFLFSFTLGGNIYDGSAKRQLGLVTDWNFRTEIGDRWTQPGDEAAFPRLTLNPYPGLPDEWQYNSTMFLYDASFVRLRNLTIGYTFPQNFLDRLGLTSARFAVTGMNLLTFTEFPGGDPEIARDFESAQDRNMSPNVTFLTPPQQRSVTFSLNVSF